MSLFRSSLRPPMPLSDEAIERYVAAIRAELDPDPLFRRRLRGHVLNRFVAAREGTAGERPVAKEMTRIGRAALYASVALAISVTGAMAASQQAAPGDVLYPLKRDIEDLRLRVLPDRFHDDLAAYALGQRIDELRRLAEQGRWTAVAAHANAVDEAYDLVVALGPDEGELAESLSVAEALLDRLPEAARDAVERALGDTPGLRLGADGDAPGRGLDRGGGPSGAGGPSGPASPAAEPPAPGGRPATDDVEPTPRPQPQPTKSPKPEKREPPANGPTPSPTVSPDEES